MHAAARPRRPPTSAETRRPPRLASRRSSTSVGLRGSAAPREAYASYLYRVEPPRMATHARVLTATASGPKDLFLSTFQRMGPRVARSLSELAVRLHDSRNFKIPRTVKIGSCLLAASYSAIVYADYYFEVRECGRATQSSVALPPITLPHLWGGLDSTRGTPSPRLRYVAGTATCVLTSNKTPADVRH